MQKHRALCECGFQQDCDSRAEADRALADHGCKVCACCGRSFRLLVDDELCIRCDAILYPDAVYPAA